MSKETLFISYAHIDNEVFGPDPEGWISRFHKALEIRLAQLRGKKPKIWRDQKLQGNDVFSQEIVDQFKKVAVLISILSPRYLASEWCAKELNSFIETASKTGTLKIGNKSTIFKIVKTLIPREQQPRELRDLLGYEFYKIDPETGRPREFHPIGGPEYDRYFWTRLDDLAQDISELMSLMEKEEDPTPAPANPDRTVYLADTSLELQEARDMLRRDLIQHGYEVLPTQPSTLKATDFERVALEDLDQARLALHLVGGFYGIVPEGTTRSIPHLAHQLALDRHRRDGFDQMVWIAPEAEAQDDRQREFHQFLRTDNRVQSGGDLFEGPLENFKSLVYKKLQAKHLEAYQPRDAPEIGAAPSVYLVCDQVDLDALGPVENYLFEQGFDVILPVFEGDPGQIRTDHQETLRAVDGILLFMGRAGELWLRAKLRELLKIVGYGRTKPFRARAIYLAETAAGNRARFRPQGVEIIDGHGGFAASLLEGFSENLRKGSPP